MWASSGSPGSAASRTSRPFRGSWRPTKKIVGPSVGHGSALANRSTSMPLKRTSYSPPSSCAARAAASADTAHRRDRRRATGRVSGASQRAGEPEHLALDPTGKGEAVGTHQRHPHTPTVPVRVELPTWRRSSATDTGADASDTAPMRIARFTAILTIALGTFLPGHAQATTPAGGLDD